VASDGGLSDGKVEMWTIYESPPDYPGKFVARLFIVRQGDPEPRATGDMAIAQSLESVRTMLPWGLALVPRSEGDDPAIVETWL